MIHHTTPRCYLYVRKSEGQVVRGEQGPLKYIERIRGTDP